MGQPQRRVRWFATLYRKLYQTRTLVEHIAAQIHELQGDEPAPRRIICDHDAEDRATLFERHLGHSTQKAHKAALPGIQAVQERLRPQDDGKPRLFLSHHALVKPDPFLQEARKPTCTAEEISGYVWDTPSGLAAAKELIALPGSERNCASRLGEVLHAG